MSQHQTEIKNNVSNVVSRETREAELSAIAKSQLTERAAPTLNLSNKQFKTLEASFSAMPDLVCLSHLRWDFVYQRPQHLLSRCAKERRVFFIEEPIFEANVSGRLDISKRESGVSVVVPIFLRG